jgi:hypothetical protein
MKKFLAVLIGGVVLMGPLSSIGHASDIPDEQWTPISYPQGDGWRSLYIADGSTLNRVPSVMYGQTPWPNSGYPKMFHCTSVDSDACVKYPIISATAFLQPCSDSIVTNCIEDFWAIDPNGQRVDATTPTAYPAHSQWDFAGNDAINLPVGGDPAVWNIPGAVNGGGTTQYMAQVFTENYLNKAENTKVTTEQFSTTRMTVAVSAVKQIYGRYLPQQPQDSTETPNGEGSGVSHPSQDEWRYCTMIDTGTCMQKQAFPADYKFGIKIRLHSKLSGWLHGRIYNPDVTITTDTRGNQVISVEATPVQVPVIGEWYKWDDLTQPIRDYILAGKVGGGQGNRAGISQPTGTFQQITETSGQDAIDALRLWLPQIKDKASASPTLWTFHNLDDGQLQDANKCIRDSKDLAGFVTTNAAVYSAGPPTFNQDTQSLDYKVISPHYTSKGDVAIGSYDLRIKSDVARCIYGFSKAPIQASISIVSEDGSIQTATETVNESDGWLSLSAKGFTYSSPTVKVKLSQQAPVPAVTPTPTPSATTKAPTWAEGSKTISCVKGKTKKKVSGFNPKCPVGYKKVA